MRRQPSWASGAPSTIAGPAPAPITPTRWFAVGDPQTTPERFFTVLTREGLLGDDGWLRSDVGLVSMGDHFDFKSDETVAEPSGRAILAWLAAHPSEQVTILAGNHDIARVAELAFESDASFAAARQLGRAIDAAFRVARRPADPVHPEREAERQAAQLHAEALVQRFHDRFPHIPTPGIASRDYSAFSVAQQRMVQALLMSGRMRLATTARLDGVMALLTHAAVTTRELALLGMERETDATRIAAALDAHRAAAVAKVAPSWRNGEPAALDLSGAHITGTTGVEGGGLLYHRPANPDRAGADTRWESEGRRRYPPADLPHGLLQVAGHSGHHNCADELGSWVDAAVKATPHAAIRTLRAGPDQASYVLGVAPVLPHASLVLIDPGLATAPLETVELLRLDDA